MLATRVFGGGASPIEKLDRRIDNFLVVVLDDIGPERVRQRHHYGSWVAGPVVRRIVEDTLPYLNVVPDIDQTPNAEQH